MADVNVFDGSRPDLCQKSGTVARMFEQNGEHQRMEIIRDLKRIALAICLLLPGFGSAGCGLHRTSPINERHLYEIREQNLKADMTSIRDMARVDSVEPTDQTGPVIEGPLTLADAIAYAMDYNLDAAVLKLEREIREEAVTGGKLRMLPSLTMEGKFSRRNNYSASFSEPLFPGDPISKSNDSYEFSRDKSNRGYSLDLSWNLVDFGISFYQHMQARNRVWIAEQRRRRVIQKLKLDVTKAFWRVQVAKAAKQMAVEFVGRLKERERILQAQLESKIVSEIPVLEASTALAEIRLKMTGFERELQKHKLKLASLMGLRGKVDFEVAEADFDSPIEKMDVIPEELEKVALRNRPELVEQDLEELITVDDARIAVSKMVPSLGSFFRYNYDSDSHIYYKQWKDIGFNLIIDLLSIPQKLSRVREARKKKGLIKKRRLSIAAAILTQLNMAVLDFENAIRKYEQGKEIGLKRRKLMGARIRHIVLGNGNIEDVLESEAKFLFAQVRALSSYADVRIEKERIINTLGCDDLDCIPSLQKTESATVPVSKVLDIASSSGTSFSYENGSFAEKKASNAPEDRLKEGGETPVVTAAPERSRVTVFKPFDVEPTEAPYDTLGVSGPMDSRMPSEWAMSGIKVAMASKATKAMEELSFEPDANPLGVAETANTFSDSVVNDRPKNSRIPSARSMSGIEGAVASKAPMALDELSIELKETHVAAIGPTDNASDTLVGKDLIDPFTPFTRAFSGIDKNARGDMISNFPYSLHLSSYKTLKETRKAISHYRKNGLSPYAFKFKARKKGVWWRVYLGCYKSRDEAFKAKAKLRLEGATVWKTPFGNLIGTYSTEGDLRDMSRKLEQLGYFPYAIKLENDMFRLLTGAFSSEKKAVEQKKELQSRGIEARVILRTNGASDTFGINEKMDSSAASARSVSGVQKEADGNRNSNHPYSLHLSSHKTLEKTQKAISYHRKNGLYPYAFKFKARKKGVWWRVYVGCYKTQEEAVNAKAELGLEGATVWKTPFANLIGTYSTESDLKDMSRKLEQLGYFPYAIKGERDRFLLLTGAFTKKRKAEENIKELQSKGIQAQPIRR